MSVTPPLSTNSARSIDSRTRAVGLLIGAALFVTLLAYLGRVIAAGELRLEQVQIAPIVLAIALLLAAYVAQAVAWHKLVQAAGGTQTVAVDAGRWAVSILGKYMPGKVFHAVGRLILYRRSAPGTAGMAAAYVAESLLTLAAAACVAAVSLWIVRDTVPALALVTATAAAVAGVLASCSTLFDRAAGCIAAHLMQTLLPPPIPIRRRVLPFALLNIASVLMGAGLYALTLAWQPENHAPVPAVVGALCLSGIAGIAAFFVPAGIGVREGAFAWVIAPVATPPVAALIAVASRVWLITGDAIAVAVGSALVRIGAAERAAKSAERFRGDFASFGFLHDREGRARRGRRIVETLKRFHRPDIDALRVLDVGCSGGLLTAEVSRHVRFTVGLDPDPAAMRYASQQLAEAGRLAFVRATGEALPFADGEFDVVVCNHVYEHARDAHAMMFEIARVLKPGGVCWFAGGHTFQFIEPHYRLPLLPLLPRRLASWVVRASGRGDGYDIRFLPPWRLRELFRPFEDARMVSVEALREPEAYALDDGVLRYAPLRALIRPLAPIVAAAAPTQLWLLRTARVARGARTLPAHADASKAPDRSWRRHPSRTA